MYALRPRAVPVYLKINQSLLFVFVGEYGPHNIDGNVEILQSQDSKTKK